MQFEDILQEVGSFGLYQRLLCFLLIPLTTSFCAFTYYFQLFVLTAPPHTCRQGDADGTLTTLLLEEPYNSEVRAPYTCHQHPANFSAPANVSLAALAAPTLPCSDGWDYDYDAFFRSYTSERDWVCDEAWRNYLVVTLFWVGNTVGSWLWGVVSDMRGRRLAIAGSMLVYGVAGAASVLARSFWLFAALRFIVGTSHHTVTHVAFVLVVEYCGMEARVVPLFTIMATYTLASVAAPALAWLIWDWTALTLLASLPPIALILTYRWLPESASWLITRGRDRDARTQLARVAKVNGRDLPEERLAALLGEAHGEGEGEGGKGKSSGSILQAVRYPRFRWNILLVLLVWMLACMCYYGHCQNTARLGGGGGSGSGVLLNYLLGALVEVPAWCVPWLIHRLGRRLPLAACFLTSAAAGFAYSMVPADMSWLVVVVALLGRAAITGAYYITLQYCPEVFPTAVRGQGVALSETLGGVAIFLSPLVVYLGEFEATLPLLVFAVLSVVGGAATLLLPETKGVALPQTLAQAEAFSKQAGPACCRSKRKGDTDKGKEEEGEEERL